MSTQHAAPHDAAPSEAAQTRRAVSNILKRSAGNLFEWYDL
jgi:MHS family alpha-ketoglutarate permease-like MFS transporter